MAKMNVAVIGATGAVGREMLHELEESTFKDINLGLFASPRSAGETMSFRGKTHEVVAFSVDGVKPFETCLMSAGGAFSRQYAKAIAENGSTVIDNSSAWRMTAGIPLIVPEVNAKELSGWKSGIIANPNCSTIQMVVPLKALHDAFGVEQVNVSTYQSVSGTGQKGVKELSTQMEAQYKFGDIKPEVYAQPIAFNVLPAIDVLDATFHCFEEEKMIRETRKIMGLPELDVMATTVRVPVFHCHCESVTVRLNKKISRVEGLEALKAMKGLIVHTDNSHSTFPTPRKVAGEREVHVARVRTPIDQERSNYLQFWVVADNLKKGAATNAVQIFELLNS